MSIGLGSLSNTELARLISRRSYKHTLQYPQILQEFENRRAGDTTIDEVLERETKEYKDWRAKNPPKYKFRNKKSGGKVKKYSYRRGGIATLRKPKRGK